MVETNNPQYRKPKVTHRVFEKSLKVADWDNTNNTQEIAIEQIVDNTLVTWNLRDDYTVDEYNACMDSGLKGKAEEGKVVFTVSEIPTEDIRLLIVVESEVEGESEAKSGWRRFIIHSYEDWFTNAAVMTEYEIYDTFMGKLPNDVIGNIDGDHAVSFANCVWSAVEGCWFAPIVLKFNETGFPLVFLKLEGVEADDPAMLPVGSLKLFEIESDVSNFFNMYWQWLPFDTWYVTKAEEN